MKIRYNTYYTFKNIAKTWFLKTIIKIIWNVTLTLCIVFSYEYYSLKSTKTFQSTMTYHMTVRHAYCQNSRKHEFWKMFMAMKSVSKHKYNIMSRLILFYRLPEFCYGMRSSIWTMLCKKNGYSRYVHHDIEFNNEFYCCYSKKSMYVQN